MSFISFNEATPSLPCSRVARNTARQQHPTYPLNPAFSCMNLLKSAMSLSIASRMCKCRTSVHTESVSDRIASLSSNSPIAVWNLYLPATGEWRLHDGILYSPVFRAVINGQQVVAHGLIGELMQEWRKSIHGSIGDEQHPTWSRRLRFLVRVKRQAP